MEEGGDSESTSVDTKNPENGEVSRRSRPQQYLEDTDNRDFWEPASKYKPEYIRAQRAEAWYMLSILALVLIGFFAVGVGAVDRLLIWMSLGETAVTFARRYEWLALGGILGGVVYSSKWLYHAIAKGLWHEDRKVWRYLSPWISLGTTIGVGALFIAGFMRAPVDPSGANSTSASTYIGLGFLIGYFSDMFLAKMKEVTQVLFGETESHFKRSRSQGRDQH